MGASLVIPDSGHTKLALSIAKQKFDDLWNNEPPCSGNLDDYEIKNSLGTGTFGHVKLAQHKETKCYCAIKIVRKAVIIKLRQLANMFSEKKILISTDFPFLVKMFNRFKDIDNLYLVLEFVPGGELFGLLKRKTRLSEHEASFYAAQVVLALEYLHFMNIIYRDLKPENVLIQHNGYIKITDFGFSKLVNGRTWTICGTPEYLAPETIQNRGYTNAVDWWALGVFIYELVAGHTPFMGSQHMEIYDKIIQTQYTFRRHFSKSLRNLISHLIEKDLSRRYGNLLNGPLDIKCHRWFIKRVNWEKIYKQETLPPHMPKLMSEDDISQFEVYPDNTHQVPDTGEIYLTEFENF